MSRYNTPRLLTPPPEEEEVYPYRRVWSSLMIEIGGIFGLTATLYILVGFLGIDLPLRRWVNLLIALTPALLWLVFSLWRERFVPEPRRHLTTVFVVAALAANGVALPLLDALAPNDWLPTATTLDRILGYALTIGVVQEAVKYLVVRFIVWPDGLRYRLDTVAYCVAAAVGYATVTNLQYIDPAISPDVVAIRVFANVVLHLAGSLLIAYGLAITRFNPQTVIVMPVAMLLASLIAGLVIAARPALSNAGFFLGASATRPLFGLVFTLAVIVAVTAIAIFLFNVAERQEREAVTGVEA